MNVTFGANPFIAIENRGTAEEPDIMLWLHEGDDPVDQERADVLKVALLQWAARITEEMTCGREWSDANVPLGHAVADHMHRCAQLKEPDHTVHLCARCGATNNG